MIALAGSLAITALGAYFAYLTVMVSPTATGAITAAVILAVTTAMGGAAAFETRGSQEPKSGTTS